MSPTRIRGRQWLCAVFLLTAGCQEAPSRWDKAQEESRKQPAAVVKESQAGSGFNRYFPKVVAPDGLVFKQEKDGYAEASLQRDGDEVAVFSVSDTANNPEAREKFDSSTEKIADYPLASVGGKGTALLIQNRLQVQIRSVADSFTEEDRKQWLHEFNLAGLAELKLPDPGASP